MNWKVTKAHSITQLKIERKGWWFEGSLKKQNFWPHLKNKRALYHMWEIETLTIPPSPPSIVCSGPADMMIFYSVSWCQSLFSLLNIWFGSAIKLWLTESTKWKKTDLDIIGYNFFYEKQFCYFLLNIIFKCNTHTRKHTHTSTHTL